MPKDTKRCSSELRRHLYPMPADVLHDIIQTFIFMPATELEAEREAISRCVPVGAGAQTPTKDQCLDLGLRFAQLAPFATPPSDDAMQRALAPLTPSQSGALHARLDQVRRAIRQARHLHGVDYDPTDVFAVQPLWHLRWESLISGALYQAFVGFLEIDRF